HYLRRLPPAAGDTQRLARAAVHDACVLRHDRETQDAVRGLLSDRKITPVPLAQERKHTLCCGEGGAAWCLDRNLPERFRQRRLAGLTDPLVVYCYACRDFLDPDHRLGIRHILEIVCGPEKRYAGWRSWLNRFFLKRWLRRILAHRI
ncbi:MAG: hypothetical protein JXR89_12280, partial [Deltaproteobacteria bacterium]|nr:hypothetical protein [Deltaproteobacteria bacterium]